MDELMLAKFCRLAGLRPALRTAVTQELLIFVCSASSGIRDTAGQRDVDDPVPGSCGGKKGDSPNLPETGPEGAFAQIVTVPLLTP